MTARAIVVMLFGGVISLLPVAGFAQTSVVGVVRDPSGAVLPGVTVEASSPALIEQVRVGLSDDAGAYRIEGLRPGDYAVTASLTGFNTVKREGIRLETDFTATVNFELTIGAVEETVVVSGQAPVVDVHNTQSREVLNRTLLDTVPTGRQFALAANMLPAVRTSGYDVGGSTTMQQSGATAYGGLGGDINLEINGMDVTSTFGTGAVGLYLNEGQFQEYVVQINGGSAETMNGGVRINQIPMEGGNRFKGSVTTFFSNSWFQSDNVTDELRQQGFRDQPGLYQLHDAAVNVGGPIVRDRLWFFGSARTWAYNNYVPRATAISPSGGGLTEDDNSIQGYPLRLTYQATQRNKFVFSYENNEKFRGHRDLEQGGVAPEAALVQRCPWCYWMQGTWDSPLSSKLLVSAGFTTVGFTFDLQPEPEVAGPSADKPFGDVAKVDLIRGTRWSANSNLNSGYRDNPLNKTSIVASMAYVTGAHSFKVGLQSIRGSNVLSSDQPGDIVQRYRNGVPDSVLLYNTPIRSEINFDLLGLYVQDSWTFNRLTLNPGLRWDLFHAKIPAQNAPAGRFTPARSFSEVDDVPNFRHWSPRLGVAYNVFGDNKTALKGSLGKYLQRDNTAFPGLYNPMALSTDTRTWNDANGDDLAELAEMGPSTNLGFGTRPDRNPDPNIRRPYQWLYNIEVEQQVAANLSVSVGYNRRDFHDLSYTQNLAATLSDYTLLTTPNPLDGSTIPVFSIAPAKLGVINQLDTTSVNTQSYSGFDIVVNARLNNGVTLMGGTSTGRTVSVTCDVSDPNNLRFCNQTLYDIPFRTNYKLSGTVPLPYGFRASALFQSVPGSEMIVTHVVNRAIVPGLTQPSVTVRLNEPGSRFNDRVNQVDLMIGKTINVRRMRLRPQLDLFNATNRSPVLNTVTTYGTSLGTPLTILPARLLRLGLVVEF